MTVTSVVGPQVGRFRNRIIRDIVVSTSIGVAMAYTWWEGAHLPAAREWAAWDAEVKKESDRINREWLQNNDPADFVKSS
ncbi:hypothetical protein BDK51DRAFT_17858 [Blyttiomyces helicus]|uniref:Cytochrome c oxidase polypeptide VIIA n=1 Tax=Blyttiomyces helicus TaxID=388810 RepID=A0A4P9WAH1_9FUNG|nr:hypothetical protein BDK51DRAFT_17858 [Blyttiomyces helicus]|eukprot:RKO89591.1 hypothetical protein BDK51DRAFT_17858 [Blyttiomyces helicus]